jgi:hypothetical protein
MPLTANDSHLIFMFLSLRKLERWLMGITISISESISNISFCTQRNIFIKVLKRVVKAEFNFIWTGSGPCAIRSDYAFRLRAHPSRWLDDINKCIVFAKRYSFTHEGCTKNSGTRRQTVIANGTRGFGFWRFKKWLAGSTSTQDTRATSFVLEQDISRHLRATL